MTATPSRRALRRCLRARRRRLSPGEQREAARAVCRHLLSDPWLRARRSWGAYLADDGELDPAPAMAALRSAGRELALPVIAGERLRFYPASASRWRHNRFGILEPDPRFAAPVPWWRLQVLLVPLVAFDESGVRLGRGGGFYDRTLGALARRPFLVGLAHECQRVAALPSAGHDVPLDAVVTPAGLTRFKGGRSLGDS